MSVRQRLTDLGIALPDVPAPLAAYVPYGHQRRWIYTAGQLPLRDGTPLAVGNRRRRRDPGGGGSVRASAR